MHYINAKSILSAKNGMNIYRGCQHGCIYCDSRSACYGMEHKFEDVAVKENALILLRQSLNSKRRRCMIGTGSMSDPYMPLEKELELSRSAAEIIEREGFGLTVLTKSDLVLRDIELFRKINEKSRFVLQMTVTTWDEKLCSILEPGVCPTSRRFEVLEIFRDAGSESIVWLCPILPFIHDSRENLMRLLEGCKKAGVRGIIWFGAGLTLRDGNREYYYKKLDEHFPGLKERYERTYGSAYEIISPRHDELDRLFHEFCKKNNIMHDNNRIFEYLDRFEDKAKEEQMSLF